MRVEQHRVPSADAATLARLVRAMERAARAAARFITARSADLRTLTWESKGPADFVSAVDRGAEDVIRALLDRPFPASATGAGARRRHLTTAFVAEESAPEMVATADVTFVVDPLDGTTNYLHGYPWYAVSIAALMDGHPVAAVVRNVPTGETFTATAGGGARRNGRPIHVSPIAEPARALIGTGFPFKRIQQLDQYVRQFALVTRGTAGVRRAGAAALDLCDVACGRFEGFWELDLAPWDIAAGMLIVREAGGRATDLAGHDAPVAHGAVVAGSALLHPWLLASLEAAGRG
ncbi:MAG: inositol monophosphatase family protein [Gemmatimonadaceae bacterium]